MAIVLGLLVLSFGFDMRQNPDHYEDRWSSDVTQSYGNFLMAVSVLCVAGYLYRLSVQDDLEEEVPEKTPILVQEVAHPSKRGSQGLNQPLGDIAPIAQKIPHLIGITGGLPPKVEIPIGRFVIGRSPDCDLVLSSQLVSRKHARLHWDGSQLKLSDLGSSNTTMVNDEEVGGECVLQDGDVIQVVDYQMEVSLSLPESLEVTVIRPRES